MEIELEKMNLYRLMYERTITVLGMSFINKFKMKVSAYKDLDEAAIYNMEGDELVMARYGTVDLNKAFKAEHAN